ncbi:MAG: hypothetical protein ACU836_06745 [Gammaproteobacteria bacterium]
MSIKKIGRTGINATLLQSGFSLDYDRVVSVADQASDGNVIEDDSLCSFLVKKCTQ